MVNIGKAYELFGQLNVPLNPALADWLEVRPRTLAALPNSQKYRSCGVTQLLLFDVPGRMRRHAPDRAARRAGHVHAAADAAPAERQL